MRSRRQNLNSRAVDLLEACRVFVARSRTRAARAKVDREEDEGLGRRGRVLTLRPMGDLTDGAPRGSNPVTRRLGGAHR